MEPSAPPEGGSAPTTPRHSIPSVPAPAAYAPLDAAAAEPPVIESPHRTRSRSTFKEPGDDPRAQLPPAPTHEHAQPEPKPAAMDVDEQLEARESQAPSFSVSRSDGQCRGTAGREAGKIGRAHV